MHTPPRMTPLSFDEIEKLAQDAREAHYVAAVEGDERAARVLHDAQLVTMLTGVLRRVRVTSGDEAILRGQVEALKALLRG